MASLPHPQLQPFTTISVRRLPATGTYVDVNATNLPTPVYLDSPSFITGAVQQVAYVYSMLGGAILDIELLPEQVYTSYQDAVLEYSKLVSLHQAKNSLGSFLGAATGTFDGSGQFLSGSFLSGTFNPALAFPRFSISWSKRVSIGLSEEAGVGGTRPFYSASVNLIDGVQEYDLQSAIAIQATSSNSPFSAAFSASAGKRITIERVYYKSPTAAWRFYAFSSGFNLAGNLSSYGMYADNTTYDVVPAYQNKMQASIFETNLYTRASHYSYEIHDNKIRLYPVPRDSRMTKLWFLFSIGNEPWEENSAITSSAGGMLGIYGVNNFNTLPFANIPFENINSIGKQWIRKYSLATSKEILSQVRGKFTTIPIPNDSVTLNHEKLSNEAKEEKEALKNELLEYLDSLTYPNISQMEAEIVENTKKAMSGIPLPFYVG